MTRRIVLVTLVTVVAAGFASAQTFERRVKGDEVSRRTTTVVYPERWSSSLDELKVTAKKKKKLVFWLQLVGDLGGAL